MEAMTISRVSRDFGVSTRMLRYYEQAGLITSFRREDYSYRMYDEEAVSRLRLVLLLRRLRIPVKQIKTILDNPDAARAAEIFRQNITELDEEITALSTIKSILERFILELEQTADIKLGRFVAGNDTLLAAIESLSLTSINFKEDKTLDNLKKAEETLSKLTNVRIVYLPPATVAAAHYIGEDPEARASEMLEKFVRETDLRRLKPDIRHYGFNHPNPVDETGFHGYEMWVTIPEGLEVPPPLEKKHFSGGMYAAHMIPMGNFDEWHLLLDWVLKSDKYEFAGNLEDQEHMLGLLEELLNYVNLSDPNSPDVQLDLLAPVRVRSNR